MMVSRTIPSIFLFLFLLGSVSAAIGTVPIAYWQLNETSGTRYDSYGSNDLTANGVGDYQDGVQGNSIFSGSFFSGYSYYTSSSSELNLSSDFTIAYWSQGAFFAEPFGSYVNKFGSYETGVESYTLGDGFYFKIIQNQTYSKNLTTSTVGIYPADYYEQWIHLAFVYKAGEYMRIYLNGTLIMEETSGIPEYIYDSGNVFQMFQDGEDVRLLDEVVIYDKALNSQQIAQIADNLFFPEILPNYKSSLTNYKKIRSNKFVYNYLEDKGEDYLTAGDLESTTYFADSIVTIDGTNTTPENVSYISTYDTINFNVTEQVIAPALDVRINYTDVQDFNQIYYRARYEGNSNVIKIQIWDYDSSVWEDYTSMSTTSGYIVGTIPVLDSEDHIQNGIVQIRFYQESTGNINYFMGIDLLILVDGFSFLSSNDHDGLSGRDNILSNHPNIIDVFYTESEINTFLSNITLQYVTDLGSTTTNNITMYQSIATEHVTTNQSWGFCNNGTDFIIGYLEGISCL